MEFWLVIVLVFIIFSITTTYFVLMFFFPEWVGITGKKARMAEKSHKSGKVADDHGEDHKTEE